MVIVWVTTIVTVLILMAASAGFVQIHAKPSETSTFTKGVATFAMFAAFSAICILPIDIFVIMQPLAGSQEDIRGLYYGIYLVLAVLVFFLIPFAYFLYEEDDGHNQLFPNAFRAAKYSLGISGGVLTVAIVLLCAHYQKLASQSGPERTQSVMSTLMGIMLVVGLLGYMTYTAYGLAELPSYFFRKQNPTWRDPESGDHRNELLSINAEIETLRARHLLRSEEVWPQKYRLEIASLRERQSRLALLCDQPTPTRRASGVSWIGVIWRRLTGFCFACLSFLIIVSLGLSIIDKLINSKCGFRCGFESNQLFANPLSLLLLASSNYFPLDLIIFSVLMFYLFTCTLIGLSQLGVRILFVKLYSIRLRKTEPNALLMGIWFMMVFLLAINLQTLVLAPHYATFGNQLITDLDGGVRPCSLNDIGNGCIPTVLWQINDNLFSNIPLIGGLTFIANIILVLVFLATLIWVTCAKKKAYIREIDEADDLGEYLIS